MKCAAHKLQSSLKRTSLEKIQRLSHVCPEMKCRTSGLCPNLPTWNHLFTLQNHFSYSLPFLFRVRLFILSYLVSYWYVRQHGKELSSWGQNIKIGDGRWERQLRQIERWFSGAGAHLIKKLFWLQEDGVIMQPSITEEQQQIAWLPAHAIVPKLGRKKNKSG